IGQIECACAIADGAAEGITTHTAGGGDRQFGADVSEGGVGVHFVAAVCGDTDGDVGEGSLEIDVPATGVGIRSDIDCAILIVDPNLSSNTFQSHAGKGSVHAGVAFDIFSGDRAVGILGGEVAFYVLDTNRAEGSFRIDVAFHLRKIDRAISGDNIGALVEMGAI